MTNEPLLFILEPHDRRGLEVGDLVVTSYDGYLRLRAAMPEGRFIVHRENGPVSEWKPIGAYTISTLQGESS